MYTRIYAYVALFISFTLLNNEIDFSIAKKYVILFAIRWVAPVIATSVLVA